ATLLAVRVRMVELFLRSIRALVSQDVRHVFYVSLVFLVGLTLSNALLALGILDDSRSALLEIGFDLEVLIFEVIDPGLGNVGL
ncbi:hypothetical protein LW956_17640, partial [Erwinia amylovora]|nr:hypothetical protein [Erwinia amylovora]